MVLQLLQDALFPLPGNCLWCAEPGVAPGELICRLCRSNWAENRTSHRCGRCRRALPNDPGGLDYSCQGGGRCFACRVRPPAYTAVSSLGGYTGLLRWTVAAIKSGGENYLLEPLADLLWRQLLADGAVFDLVAYIPAHRRRLARRGFNPAQLLAEKIAIRARRPLLHAGLSRSRPALPQTGRGRGERWRNQADAFKAGGATAVGNRVLLVDDVLTTGSTADAASQALLAAGCTSVWVAVLAETTSKPKPDLAAPDNDE